MPSWEYAHVGVRVENKDAHLLTLIKQTLDCFCDGFEAGDLKMWEKTGLSADLWWNFDDGSFQPDVCGSLDNGLWFEDEALWLFCLLHKLFGQIELCLDYENYSTISDYCDKSWYLFDSAHMSADIEIINYCDGDRTIHDGDFAVPFDLLDEDEDEVYKDYVPGKWEEPVLAYSIREAGTTLYRGKILTTIVPKSVAEEVLKKATEKGYTELTALLLEKLSPLPEKEEYPEADFVADRDMVPCKDRPGSWWRIVYNPVYQK